MTILVAGNSRGQTVTFAKLPFSFSRHQTSEDPGGDQNAVQYVAACGGAYQSPRPDHLMLFSVVDRGLPVFQAFQ